MVSISKRKSLTTHVLDTSTGKPAENVTIQMERHIEETNQWIPVATGSTNSDGRVTDLLPGFYDKERLCWTLAAEQGYPDAQYNLGIMYAKGDGIEQSDKKAIELYKMAAKRGNADAQFNLGQYYFQGIYGLTQSSKRAINFFSLAAEQGHAEAQCNLGVMYANGDGIETSYSKAREWWTKAACF